MGRGRPTHLLSPFPPGSPAFAMAFNTEVRFSDYGGASDPGIQEERPGKGGSRGSPAAFSWSLSMPCSLRRTWRFFRSAVHSPTSSVARKHAERGESAGCHAGTGPYAVCNKGYRFSVTWRIP